MSRGIPLTDGDRIPWLESHRDAIRERLDRGEDVTVSCSALQHKYREILREGGCSYRSGSGSYSRIHVIYLYPNQGLLENLSGFSFGGIM
ncbi:hypothetical protein E2562_032465 [Oryza meyeriana var. granulata]|uniref:gluconokinase n=1 Tax=Oryza meyeriana var. granulata TaxID=110450 RepID=A0A6G1FEM4_9ORYZ|nr:hypothetical protein E2562_032465 [Oryza meyeriana var. granulata]